MSKRNFILLIIVLVLVVATILGFLYFRQPPVDTTGDPGGTNFFSQLNPFGTNKGTTGTTPPPSNVTGYQPPADGETTKLKLIKVSSMPIAGFTVFMKERLKDIPIVVPTTPSTEETTTINTKKPTTKPTPPPTEFVPALRYVDMASGNIYQTFVDKIEERKFSTTLIPKVYDAYFGNRGQTVVMRYLKKDDKTIETFVSTLPKELLGGDTTGNNEITGLFLPINVKDISLSPDNLRMFYLFNSGDSMVGTIFNFSNNKKIQIFDSPFTEWLSSWGGDRMITLSTKPSSGFPGYMYTMDSAGKNLIKILGDINGLTTLVSPNGKLILYGDNTLALNIYHTDTRKTDLLGLKTLPEKCVWGKISDVIYCAVPKLIDGTSYPDVWYQGEVSFNDQLWKIDVKTGNTTLLLDPGTTLEGNEVDGIKFVLDESESYLFFINKKDSFLWKLDLK